MHTDFHYERDQSHEMKTNESYEIMGQKNM